MPRKRDRYADHPKSTSGSGSGEITEPESSQPDTLSPRSIAGARRVAAATVRNADRKYDPASQQPGDAYRQYGYADVAQEQMLFPMYSGEVSMDGQGEFFAQLQALVAPSNWYGSEAGTAGTAGPSGTSSNDDLSSPTPSSSGYHDQLPLHQATAQMGQLHGLPFYLNPMNSLLTNPPAGQQHFVQPGYPYPTVESQFSPL